MIEVTELYVACQGEGRNMGRPSIFLRLRRCVLSCSWCDSKFTWDKTNPGFAIYQTLTPEALVSELVKLAEVQKHWPEGLVITGGEPMIWQRELLKVIRQYAWRCDSRPLTPRKLFVEVETAGTIVPSEEILMLAHFNVSPKLNSAGNEGIPIGKLWNQEALTRYLYSPNAVFKLVVGKGDEVSLGLFLGVLSKLVEQARIPWVNVARRIYLMPEGQTRFEIEIHQARILELAMEHGVNATTRMHVIAHDNERRR